MNFRIFSLAVFSLATAQVQSINIGFINKALPFSTPDQFCLEFKPYGKYKVATLSLLASGKKKCSITVTGDAFNKVPLSFTDTASRLVYLKVVEIGNARYLVQSNQKQKKLLYSYNQKFQSKGPGGKHDKYFCLASLGEIAALKECDDYTGLGYFMVPLV